MRHGDAGLFHVAWLHPSRAALAATTRRVVGEDWSFDGAADHHVSEALYLHDPDGLGIEIYADRPREQWPRLPDGSGVEMVTLALDLQDLLASSPGPPSDTIAPGTNVGHVHLQVSDLPRTAAFYTGGLGFERQAQIPSAEFVSAGGYHHHVGLNSWQSRGAPSAPASAPGLRRVDFSFAGDRALEELERRAAQSPQDSVPVRGQDGTLTLVDPDGEQLSFSAR